MSIRPHSHQIGDLAIAQTTALLASAGWIVERTSADYGEDLSVQICDGDKIAPFRLYLQIKGTTRINKYRRGEIYRFSGLKHSTLERWLAANHPIVFVLWDVLESVGAYTFIDEDAMKRSAAKQRASIDVPLGNVLDQGGLPVLGMRALLRYSDLECLRAHGLLALVATQFADEPAAKKEVARAGATALVRLRLLTASGPRNNEDYNVTDTCAELFTDYMAIYVQMLVKEGASEERLESARKSIIEQSSILVILDQADRTARDFVPVSVLLFAAQVLSIIMKSKLECLSLSDFLGVIPRETGTTQVDKEGSR